MGVIDDAVRLEERSEATYRQAAARAANPSARRLFHQLADAEAAHAAALRARKDVESLRGPNLLASASAWVHGAVEGGASALSLDADLPGLLRQAMDLERETGAFYRRHAGDASDPHVVRLFEELAEIEEQHYALISSLVEYYSRPREWVESAEFGLRQEY